jgi:hypothetical protein
MPPSASNENPFMHTAVETWKKDFKEMAEANIGKADEWLTAMQKDGVLSKAAYDPLHEILVQVALKQDAAGQAAGRHKDAVQSVIDKAGELGKVDATGKVGVSADRGGLDAMIQSVDDFVRSKHEATVTAQLSYKTS